MPYMSKSSLIADQQLRVQELCVRFSDLGLYSASGNDVTVVLGENIEAVAAAMHCDNSGPSVELVAQADIDLSVDQEVTVTLAAPFASDDCLILKYIVQE